MRVLYGFSLLCLSLAQTPPVLPATFSFHIDFSSSQIANSSYLYAVLGSQLFLEANNATGYGGADATIYSVTNHTAMYVSQFFDHMTCAIIQYFSSPPAFSVGTSVKFNGTTQIRGINCDVWYAPGSFISPFLAWYFETGTANPVRLREFSQDNSWYMQWDFQRFTTNVDESWFRPQVPYCNDMSQGTAQVSDDELVNDPVRIAQTNSLAKTWKAVANPRFDKLTLKEAKNLVSPLRPLTHKPKPSFDWTKGSSRSESESRKKGPPPIPVAFDTRTKWPMCSMSIRNQESCGSCWAFGATTSLSYRRCIASLTSSNVLLSPQYLVNCDADAEGCGGGWLDLTWMDLQHTGVSTDACVPYTATDGPCSQTCQDGSAAKIIRTASAYSVFNSTGYAETSAEVQVELMNHGPMEVAFYVFSDFMTYGGGVYHRTSASLAGSHGVTLIGWGVDDGTPYWLLQNSWGPGWGEQGYFRMIRGQNDCCVEDNTCSGLGGTLF